LGGGKKNGAKMGREKKIKGEKVQTVMSTRQGSKAPCRGEGIEWDPPEWGTVHRKQRFNPQL